MPTNYQNKQLHPTPLPPPKKNTLKIKSCREKLNKKNLQIALFLPPILKNEPPKHPTSEKKPTPTKKKNLKKDHNKSYNNNFCNKIRN